ncbi:cytochrome P450 [Hyaloraphidium curvatum]|nr:cytochrome P450 [Hyaloraphidium curvatum]
MALVSISLTLLLAAAVAAVLAWRRVADAARFLAARFSDYFLSPMRSIPAPFSALWNPNIFVEDIVSGARHFRWEAIHDKLGSIVRTNTFTVSVADPALAQCILKARDLPKASIFYDLFRLPQLPPSMFNTTDKDYHRTRRRLMSPSFSIAYLNGLEGHMSQVWSQLTGRVDRDIASTPEKEARLNIVQLMNGAASDVIGATAFGQSFGAVDSAEQHPFLKAMDGFLKSLMMWTAAPQLFEQWRTLPTAGSLEFMEKFTADIVAERQQLTAANPDAAPKDILQNLITAKDKESGATLNFDEIVTESSLMLGAGGDTTAMTMSWVIYFLAKNPEYVPKLRAELASLPRQDGLFHHSDLKALPLLNGMINETLRLHPLNVGVPRMAPAGGFTFERDGKNVTIPENTVIIVNTWTMHRSPALWKRARDWWPERWQQAEAEEAEPGPRTVYKDAFFPFSMGSRDCIGKNFAMQEMRIMIANFVVRYDFRLAEGSETVEPCENFVLQPAGKRIDMMVRRRATNVAATA